MTLYRLTPNAPRQRGAALLMAMVIVTLVATMASIMVSQQWRAVQVEGAERARVQLGWLLAGGTHFARIILKEDANKSANVDSLDEVWAKPMAEARLSTFLAADKDNNASDENDDAPEAFLSGQVSDAQAKFNLTSLVDDATNDLQPDQLAIFQRLCENIGRPPSLATGVAQAYLRARLVLRSDDPAVLAKLGGPAGRAQAPLLPQTVDQLAWLGLGPVEVEALRPYVVFLPLNERDAKVNANTASAVVLAAFIDIPMGGALRLVQARQHGAFKTWQDIQPVLGKTVNATPNQPEVNSKYYEITGRIRLDDNVIEQRNLVRRESNDVILLSQTRTAGRDPVDNGAAPP